MNIETMYPTFVITPAYRIFYEFINDPRNLYSREVVIHNRLRQERCKRIYMLYCGRGNGKTLRQNELYKLLYGREPVAIRSVDIPKQDFGIEQIKQTIAELELARQQDERYEKLSEYLNESCEQWVKRRTEEELQKVWITSASPYWEPIIRPDSYIFHTEYMCEWPNAWKWGVASDVFRESD